MSKPANAPDSPDPAEPEDPALRKGQVPREPRDITLNPGALPTFLRTPACFLFRQPPLLFSIVTAACMMSFVCAVELAVKLRWGWDSSLSHDPSGWGDPPYLVRHILVASIFGPVLQLMIPTYVLGVFTLNGWRIVMILGAHFVLFHRAVHPWSVGCFASVGMLLGAAFVYWLRRSWWTAYWVTALAWAIYNSCALLLRTVGHGKMASLPMLGALP